LLPLKTIEKDLIQDSNIPCIYMIHLITEKEINLKVNEKRWSDPDSYRDGYDAVGWQWRPMWRIA